MKKFIPSVFLSVLFPICGYAQANFLYVNNNTTPNTVSAFLIGGDGALTPVIGSPFPTGGMGAPGFGFSNNQAAVSMTGNFLFVTNALTSNVSAFSINPSTGILTSVPGSPFATNGVTNMLASTPDGQFLMVANNNGVTAFSIAVNGSLAPVSTAPLPFANPLPDGIKVAPNGRFLAVALGFTGSTVMFVIESNGSLTPVPGSPFNASNAGVPTNVDINCASSLLFTGRNVFSGTLALGVSNIAANGVLTEIPGSPFAIDQGANTVLLSPDERLLYASRGTGISVFNVATNGSLSLVPGSASSAAASLPFFHVGLATNQQGTSLYTVDGFGKIYAFNVSATGLLTQVPGSPFIGSGETRVAGIVAYPSKICPPPFDLCIQDDSNGSILRINSTTGDYQFSNCSGLALSGTGGLTKKGNLLTLQQYAADRRLLARIDGSVNRATASIQAQGITFTITDRNTADDICACTVH